MHSPETVAFDIKYPWKSKNSMYRDTFITIWHVDPETDGTDDSCGWFIRSRHLDQDVLQKIINDFDVDWDTVFTGDSGTIYNCGLFKQNGQPHLSVMGVTLYLFYRAASQIFKAQQKGEGFQYQKKANKYIHKHLADILSFAENPVDSLFDSITRKFEIGCNEEYTERNRRQRIEKMASIIYSYIMRDLRPWYKHPKWHIHHWKIQIHPLQKIIGFIFDRCCFCGKKFGWNESRYSSWNGDTIWHSNCDTSIKNKE